MFRRHHLPPALADLQAGWTRSAVDLQGRRALTEDGIQGEGVDEARHPIVTQYKGQAQDLPQSAELFAAERITTEIFYQINYFSVCYLSRTSLVCLRHYATSCTTSFDRWEDFCSTVYFSIFYFKGINKRKEDACTTTSTAARASTTANV